MIYYQHNKSVLRSVALMLIYLFIGLKCKAQSNLLLNGNLSDFKIDSLNLQNEFYQKERVGVIMNEWDELNKCQTDYNPQYSHTNNTYLLVTLYERIGPSDVEIFNAIGKLCRPLAKGKIYSVTFYVKPFSGNAFASGISVLFTDTVLANKIFIDEKESRDKYSQPVRIKPDFINTTLLNNKDSFVRVEAKYRAKGGERFISIGNFNRGKPQGWKETKVYGLYKKTYDYTSWCMYAISDISVFPIDTIEISCEAITQSKTDTINLPSIYFDSNNYKTPGSLNTIIELCKKFENYTLQIIGYTDNEGLLLNNQILSEKRAGFIADFLKTRIKNKMHVKGLANSFPIENKNSSSLNRRVELKLILP